MAQLVAARLLVVEARFYQDIADQLHAGALAAIQKHKIEADFVSVPGALEIPPVIRFALNQKKNKKYDGYVALGCVIRGQTTHYELVSEMSAWGLMKLSVEHGLAIGNGILTVENKAQAAARADPQKGDKGGDKGGGAVEACLALIDLSK